MYIGFSDESVRGKRAVCVVGITSADSFLVVVGLIAAGFVPAFPAVILHDIF